MIMNGNNDNIDYIYISFLFKFSLRIVLEKFINVINFVNFKIYL